MKVRELVAKLIVLNQDADARVRIDMGWAPKIEGVSTSIEWTGVREDVVAHIELSPISPPEVEG